MNLLVTILVAAWLLLSFVAIRSVVGMLDFRARIRRRLTYSRRRPVRTRKSSGLVEGGRVLVHHVDKLLDVTGRNGSRQWFWSMTICSGVAGLLAGLVLFSNLKGILTGSILLGSMPYLILRMSVISIRMRSRTDFLPAIEIFYQTYLMEGHGNVRAILTESNADNRLPRSMQPIFEQLQRNLLIREDFERALAIFAIATGHLWGQYFLELIRGSLSDGLDIAPGLRELIQDMRSAQLADQAARNRLLEIRLANFAPLVFLALFLAVNFRFDYPNAYFYYLVDPSGRNMLLNGLVLIFLSFLMGIYLSMKRM